MNTLSILAELKKMAELTYKMSDYYKEIGPRATNQKKQSYYGGCRDAYGASAHRIQDLINDIEDSLPVPDDDGGLDFNAESRVKE